MEKREQITLFNDIVSIVGKQQEKIGQILLIIKQIQEILENFEGRLDMAFKAIEQLNMNLIVRQSHDVKKIQRP